MSLNFHLAIDKNITPIQASYKDVITKFAYTGSDVEYIGKAAPGVADSAASWQIKKLAYSSGNVTNITFASGSMDFTFIWDSRATYSYS